MSFTMMVTKEAAGMAPFTVPPGSTPMGQPNGATPKQAQGLQDSTKTGTKYPAAVAS